MTWVFRAKAGGGNGRAQALERGDLLLPAPWRLALIGVLSMALLAGIVIAAMAYAVHHVDTASIADETARARVATELLLADGAQPGPAMAERLGRDFSLPGARLAAAGTLADGEVSIPLGQSGDTLAWTPRRYGSDALAAVLPIRLAVTTLALLGMGLALHRLYRVAQYLEARRLEARELATRDALTGLHNRLAFDAALRTAIGKEEQLALFYLDLDDFKRVNDTLGHAAGDALLRILGDRLAAFTAHGCLVARLGGDEFALLLRGVPSHAALSELAGDICMRLGAPYALRGTDISVTVSVGVAVARAETRSAEALLHAADGALYRAKAQKGGFVFAEAGEWPAQAA